MTTLTPQQRIEAYEYAKKCQLSYIEDYLEDGVCYDLSEWCKKELGYTISVLDIPQFFLELLAQKPEVLPGGGFWFTTRTKRIAALERAIELTKKSIEA